MCGGNDEHAPEDARSLRETPEHLLEAVGLERDAMAELTALLGCREERSWLCAAESQVLF